MNPAIAPPLSIPMRTLLTAVAFVGSTLYALSFWLVYGGDKVTAMAWAVGASAGGSWIIFGLVLLGVTRCRPSVMAWADACLLTMSAGMATKTLSMALNLGAYLVRSGAEVTPVPMPLHYAVLASANLIMAVVFIRRARRLGLSAPKAAAMWFVVLNGLFVVIIMSLRGSGGMSP